MSLGINNQLIYNKLSNKDIVNQYLEVEYESPKKLQMEVIEEYRKIFPAKFGKIGRTSALKEDFLRWNWKLRSKVDTGLMLEFDAIKLDEAEMTTLTAGY